MVPMGKETAQHRIKSTFKNTGTFDASIKNYGKWYLKLSNIQLTLENSYLI